jgi:hypothetical protein
MVSDTASRCRSISNAGEEPGNGPELGFLRPKEHVKNAGTRPTMLVGPGAVHAGCRVCLRARMGRQKTKWPCGRDNTLDGVSFETLSEMRPWRPCAPARVLGIVTVFVKAFVRLDE